LEDEGRWDGVRRQMKTPEEVRWRLEDVELSLAATRLGKSSSQVHFSIDFTFKRDTRETRVLADDAFGC
jgi:hypothetical protein